MKALIDADMEQLIGHYWISSTGYAMHGNDTLVHRTISEYVVGRKLVGRECVHHLNYNKLDNRRENLVICPNDAYHKLLHARTDMLNDGANPDKEHYCTYHKAYHIKEAFSSNKRTWNGLHNMCREGTNIYRKERGLNKGNFNWRALSNQQYRRAKKKNIEVCWLDEEGTGL